MNAPGTKPQFPLNQKANEDVTVSSSVMLQNLHRTIKQRVILRAHLPAEENIWCLDGQPGKKGKGKKESGIIRIH